MRLLIMGPPGAGKGTQAKMIAEHYGIPAISTGDIFRAMQTADTPLAKQVRAIMASGGYVSDEITNEIVADRLAQADCESGFLLDGYPRTLQQVDRPRRDLPSTAADRRLISLTADEDEVVARLLKRAEIEGRADDNEETIRDPAGLCRADRAAAGGLRSRGLLVEVTASARSTKSPSGSSRPWTLWESVKRPSSWNRSKAQVDAYCALSTYEHTIRRRVRACGLVEARSG